MGQTIAESLIEQGLAQGLERGKRELLLHMIQTKFGQVPDELKTWLSGLSDPAALDKVGEGLVRATTLEELQTYRTPEPARKRRRPRSS